jgi:hypothetical protein
MFTVRIPRSLRNILLLCLMLEFTGAFLDLNSVRAQSTIPSRGQIWGLRNDPGGYSGGEATMSSPNPQLTKGNGNYATAHAVITNRSNSFIEAGAIKDCRLATYDCLIHPYSSWQDASGQYSEFVDRATTHTNASTFYTYATRYLGNNQWQGYWCNTSNCFSLSAPNLGQGNGFPWILSGGESYTSTTPMGTIITKNNKSRAAGSTTLKNFCYTTSKNNTGSSTVSSGTLTTCNTSTYEWTIRFGTQLP